MSVRFLSTRFSMDYLGNAPCRKLYMDVSDSLFPAPRYRALYSGGPGQDVLKRVKRLPVQPGGESFCFKLHLGTLTVQIWLKEKGLGALWGTDCTIRKRLDKTEHVFIHCWMTVHFWDVMERTLHKDFLLNPAQYLAVTHGLAPWRRRCSAGATVSS